MDFLFTFLESNDKPNYYGAIVSSDHQARTCMVNWFKLENGSSVRLVNIGYRVEIINCKTYTSAQKERGISCFTLVRVFISWLLMLHVSSG